MAVIPWKPAGEMTHITKNTTRVDAVPKVTGKAEFSYDVLPKDALIGLFVTSPYPNCTAVTIDTAAAEALPGVKAVWTDEGKVCRMAGEFVAAVAAETRDIARDAVRRVRVEWERYPFVVKAEDARQPNSAQVHGATRPNVNRAADDEAGDVDAAFESAAAVVDGTYSTQVQTHTSLESHGMTCRWDDAGENIRVWASTQGVFSVRGELAGALEMPESNVVVTTDYMGGGFGSKFGAGVEGIVCARMARDAGRAVKLLLTREQEQTNSGNRPSSVQHIRAAADAEGRVTAFDMQAHGTGGYSAGAGFPAPYIYGVFGDPPSIPNRRIVRDDVYINAGNARAMRAPGHPQASFGMESTMDELAYALDIDPIDLRVLNDPNETRQAQYRDAAKRIGWSRRNAEPGADAGPVKTGFGIGAATWGGGGGGTRATVDIHSDGSVVVKCGTQDLGTGTRTVVAAVAAEQLGLAVEDITPLIGDTRFPPSGGSGGSTTCASVAPAIKVTADAALATLFGRAAPALDAQADNLEAVDRTIRRIDDPSKSLAWADACALLGAEPISETEQHDGSLSSRGTAGVCAVELTVDEETGDVRIRKVVSVQEAGLVIDKLTLESQLIGAVIQGISYALHEDRVMDRLLGHQVNANMEFYKISGAMDIPEIEPVVWMAEESLSRGVIGIGEPPVIPVAAAIGNAVRNATGARVAGLPITPRRVLEALEREGRAQG
jgi:xanthine dehydrogenase YagR molybdenum-binding subunit